MTQPSGAGFFSPAALGAGIAFALQGFSRGALDRVTLAQLYPRAETACVGVKTEIKDQYASALGEPNKVLLVDCRTLK